MEKLYIGIRAVGDWREVIGRVTQSIRYFNLSRTIPYVKPEKKPKGEHYIFLSINGSPNGAVEQNIKLMLKSAGLTPPRKFDYLPADAIKTMVSRAEFEIRAFHTFRRKIKSERDLSDPFEAFEISETVESENDVVLESRYELLLAWLSATGKGSRHTFAKTCDRLGLTHKYMPARRIMRNLILLGHVETSADGEQWTICPPTFVRCPLQPEFSYFCGARTPHIIGELKENWEIELLSQPRSESPACIRVACGKLPENQEKKIGHHAVHVAGCSSEKLSQILPDAQEWSETLTKVDNVVTAKYTPEKWNGAEYEEFDGVLETGGALIGEHGLYCLTHRDDKRRLTLYLDGKRKCWLRGDWYGLYFLSRYNDGEGLTAKYDRLNRVLMIPSKTHLPILYERALILASGRLPNQTDGWLRYENIPEATIQMLTNKLDFSVEEKNYA